MNDTEWIKAEKWPQKKNRNSKTATGKEVNGLQEMNEDISDMYYDVPLSKEVYIERDDFRIEDVKGYYGLAPNKAVMLRYAYPITCTGFKMRSDSGEKGVDQEVEEVYCTIDFAKSKKPKGVIHWVSSDMNSTCPASKTPAAAEIRLYNELFLTPDVNDVDDWMEDINPSSIIVIPDALISVNLYNDAQSLQSFQFERIGYFCVDPSSQTTLASTKKLIFNRTVTLKESISTASARKK